MSDSWRISVNEIDRSQTINATPGNRGAMVIRAGKGPVEPVLIDVADENRILDIFGKPSSTWPDVWEAIQFNREAPIWLSAPYDSTATLGGVIVRSVGTGALNESDGIDPDSLTDYTFGTTTDYMIIVSKSPYDDDLGIQVSYSSTTDFFTIVLSRTADGGTTWTVLDTYIVSITEDQKDGFGSNIFAEVLLLDNDYIQVYVNSSGDTTSGFSNDSAVVAFGGGDRGSTITITELTTGWDYFQKSRTYAADIFMDSTSDGSIPTLFDTLRGTYQKYATYLLPLPDNAAVAASVITKAAFSINNRGLAFYWNYGRVNDTYNNSSFWTTLIGRVGRKFAQMVNVYNGLPPSWVDENNHGGQLGSGILEMRYDPSETDLETLDIQGINGIVFDPGYGVMIASQKTAQSPLSLSDDSWIAHSRLFDYIISTVKEQVLVYQITKLVDDLHMQLARGKTDSIISPITAAGIIAEYGVQCDSGNNTAVTLAARKFVLTVAVKVTPFSETVVFNFVKIGQTSEVSQYIA